ncbi:cupin domain-containing protein [Ferrimonas marina]|uniref:Anti-sigma factor ChrR, cupin superfamily n=1 Tax=Ferrimonas marina TaxID=299255 RepID=A0A1M5RHD4_9GAMM|nr:cupin domain-containing protein [Ferrimonas marina]SHH25747.1 Anti-sigma factor ChrR, cupin superfamily [Ferrimonas marina]
MNEQLNSLGVEVVEAALMEWQNSPAEGVLRKRLRHLGPAESGMVTSLVRYRPGSHFARHYHPEGEEILVLEGVFSDEHGDYPAGSYLLNPDGSGHRPFSEPGCLLLVKLRQYAGARRQQVAIDTGTLAWQSLNMPGVSRKLLYRQTGFPERISLVQLKPGTVVTDFHHPLGAEMFVVEGEVQDGERQYGPETFVRFPAGHLHSPASASGCVLYLKEGQ